MPVLAQTDKIRSTQLLRTGTESANNARHVISSHLPPLLQHTSKLHAALLGLARAAFQNAADSMPNLSG